jgi:hypothetical protein
MKQPRPAFTYRGHRRLRHFRDGLPFKRLSGSNWKRDYEEKLKAVRWPRRMMGFFYKFGGRAFWNKIKPQIEAQMGRKIGASQGKARQSPVG